MVLAKRNVTLEALSHGEEKLRSRESQAEMRFGQSYSHEPREGLEELGSDALAVITQREVPIASDKAKAV